MAWWIDVMDVVCDGVGGGEGTKVERAAGGWEESDIETAHQATGDWRAGRAQVDGESQRVAQHDLPAWGREIRPREEVQISTDRRMLLRILWIKCYLYVTRIHKLIK